MITISLKLTEQSALYLSHVIDDRMETLAKECEKLKAEGDSQAIAANVREWRALQPVADELKAKGSAVFLGW